MRTFKKFNNREEYKNWVIQLWESLEKWNDSFWEPEDEEALKPFWVWSASSSRFNDEPMPDEVKPLVTLYLDKSKEYADERKELVSSFTKLAGNMESFFYFFLFDYEEDENSDSDFYDLNDFSVNEVVPDEPFICFIWVDSDFDRLGDMDIQVLDIITERELNER